MEQRREPRFEIDQPVVVTILTDPPASLVAKVRNASGRGLGLMAPKPVPPGVAVEIELDDMIVLGEAIYCRNEQEQFFIGVELDQILVGLTELGRKLESYDADAPKAALDSGGASACQPALTAARGWQAKAPAPLPLTAELATPDDS